MPKNITKSKYDNKTPSKSKNGRNSGSTSKKPGASTPNTIKAGPKIVQEIQNIKKTPQHKQQSYIKYRSNQIVKNKNQSRQKTSKTVQKTSSKTSNNNSATNQKLCTYNQRPNNPPPIQEIQKQSNTSNDRIQQLRIYLKEDTHRMTAMKRQSDQHVIQQLKITQQKLKEKLSRASDQSHQLINKHRKQTLQLEARYQTQSMKQAEEIQKLKLRLSNQNGSNTKIMIKNDQENQELKVKMEQKCLEIEKLRKIINHYKQIPSIKREQAADQTDKDHQSKYIAQQTQLYQFKQQIRQYAHRNNLLEIKISNLERDKAYIKQNCLQLLQFIRNQCEQEEAYEQQGLTELKQENKGWSWNQLINKFF